MSTIANDIQWRMGLATHPLALNGLAQELKFARLSPEERRAADAALAERFEFLKSRLEAEFVEAMPLPLASWVNEGANG